MLMISYYFLLQIKNCKHALIRKTLRFCEDMEASSEYRKICRVSKKVYKVNQGIFEIDTVDQ